jgi:hypothetical protein
LSLGPARAAGAGAAADAGAAGAGAAVAPAQSVISRTERGPTTAQTGGLTGHIVGEPSGAANLCVSVGLLRADSPGGAGAGAEVGTGVTGGDGTYLIGGLRPGSYELTASPCTSPTSPASPGTSLIASRVVHVISGATLPVAPLQLGGAHADLGTGTAGGATLAGQVKQVSGATIRGVCVAAVSGATKRVTVSKAKGHYSISSLSAGTYTVVVDPCQTGVNVAPAVVGTVAVGASGQHTLNITMHPGATLAGTVTAGGGGAHRGLRGICVSMLPIAPAALPPSESAALLELGPNFLKPAATSAKGTYSVAQLPPWRFVVSYAPGCGNNGNWVKRYTPGTAYPWLSSPISIAAGRVTHQSAVLARGGSLIGRVYLHHGSAATLRGMCVEAGPPTSIGTPSVTLTGRRSVALGYFSAPVNTKGRFDLRGMPAGAFSLVTVPDCYVSRSHATVAYFGNTPASPGRLVSVAPAQQVRHLRFRVVGGAGMTGVIRSRGHAVGREAFCMRFERPRNAATVLSAYVVTTASGRYRVAELPPGRWIIRVQSCRPGAYAPAWYGGGLRPSLARPVAFHSGKTARHVRFDLQRAGAISGVVTKPNGKPLRQACVAASAPGEYTFAITHRHGQYHLTGLGTGKYTVTASRCNGITRLAGVVRHGVRARAGSLTQHVNFKMTKGARINGFVLSRGHRPLPGECVVTRGPRGTFGPTAVSQADGSFYLFGVPAGRVSLRIVPGCSAQVGYGPKLAGRFHVRPGAVVDAGRIRLSKDGTISGVVKGKKAGSSTQTPLAGACVLAYPARGAHSHVPLELAETLPNGSYVLTQLQPGRYDVEFRSGCGAKAYTPQWWNHVAYRQQARHVQVKNGSDVGGISATLVRR